LAGHSIAGEELSSVGSRHPEKVAGLIYLEAGYGYAYYSRPSGELSLDMAELGKRIEAQQSGAPLDQHNALAMQAGAAQLEHDLEAMTKQMALVPNLPEPSPAPPVMLAVQFGEQKYTEVQVPVLAIFACPHNFDFPGATAAIKQGLAANDLVSCTAQSKAFAAGIPTARVVLLPGAEHMVFRSNEADVIREMLAFLATLP
jgi:pimeloyl-ACP methyl ester carboxylesterase